ncbi:diphthine synthase [Dimargaris cristalligena]|uniref:diphthine methyl ester synthase n=1 Tax=Dimargaris cristalligena TaxID=215637 RepID=A0A4P9ZU11_9FUNG|nr:diphthine synthase [Dimargaris cristalligena]|eukprot:RKP37034.1 diphthine synthase [Dimargaris cristalligena]
MFYVIGLGLADERDITVKGLETVRRCKRVYLEAYTSILLVEKTKLEDYYGCPVIVADREMVESESDTILENAGEVDVAFLVVGDPFGATTHSDLVLRARELGIPVQIIHNASIMNAAGACGVQLYNFGQTVSIVFFTDTWRPDSFYARIQENRSIGLHTLCLLDIKVKEQTMENLARGRKIYEPPRYMTINQCIEQLLEVEAKRGEKIYTADTLAVGIARVGAGDEQVIKAGTLGQLQHEDFGPPLHSLVLLGSRLHFLEFDMLRQYSVGLEKLNEVIARDYEH